MLKTRIIPCLDVADGRVVKGVNFVGLRDAGDPVESARAYDAAGADEPTAEEAAIEAAAFEAAAYAEPVEAGVEGGEDDAEEDANAEQIAFWKELLYKYKMDGTESGAVPMTVLQTKIQSGEIADETTPIQVIAFSHKNIHTRAHAYRG